MDSEDSSFDLDLQEAVKSLETYDALLISLKSLNLCRHLSITNSFDEYNTIFSSCVSFFGQLIKFFRDNADKLGKIVEICFYRVLLCNDLIPRLYLSFLFACIMKKQERIDFIIKMIPAASHPLRGILVRFFAISFYPHDLPSILDFAESNFMEMHMVYPKLLELFPQSAVHAKGWLVSNISISLYSNSSNAYLVEKFMSAAIFDCTKSVSIAIVNAVIQSLSSSNLIEFSEHFIKFITISTQIDECSRLSRLLCLRSRSPEFAFSFASRVACYESLIPVIIQLSTDSQSINIIEKTLLKWPSSNTHKAALKSLKPELFSDIAPPISDIDFLEEYIKNITINTKPESVRKMVEPIILNRPVLLEKELVNMLIRLKRPKDLICVLFSEPFVYNSMDLLEYVYENQSLDVESIRKLITRISCVPKNDILSFSCRKWDCNCVSSFIDLFLSIGCFNSDDTNILLNRIKNVSLSDNDLAKIIDTCKTEDTLTQLFNLSQNTQFKKKCVRTMLELDGYMNISSRISLYISAMKLISQIMDGDMLSEIFNCATDCISITQSYPTYILCDFDTLCSWIKGIEEMIEIPFYEPNHDQLENLINQLRKAGNCL